MAQFSTEKNRLLGNNNALYEVVMIAGQSGPSVFIPKGNLNASTDGLALSRLDFFDVTGYPNLINFRVIPISTGTNTLHIQYYK